MISTGILFRVFRIFYEESNATSFTINYLGNQYLITARHLFNELHNDGDLINIKLIHLDKLIDLSVEVYFHVNKSIDIAVLKIDKQLYAGDEPLFGIDGITLAQDMYFLGFPFGLGSPSKFSIFNINFPFIKKGILSAIITENNSKLLIVDGINNPGFSGGPVCFQNDGKWQICSVISGYYNQPGNVDTPIGSFVTYQNSGLVRSFSIEYAFEIIDKLIN